MCCAARSRKLNLTVGHQSVHRLNLQQRMILWFAGIILALLACVLAFLHLRIITEMHNQVTLELGRTRMLFESVQRSRSEELLNQCMIFASLPRLRVAADRQSPAEMQQVMDDYACMLGADTVAVIGLDGKPLVHWWRPSFYTPHSALGKSIPWSLHWAREHEPQTGMDVTDLTIYQTACCPVLSPYGGRLVGALLMGSAIDGRFARRLGMMSGAQITFFSGSKPNAAALPDLDLIASTLPDEKQERLKRAILAGGHSPLRVPATGLENPYVVDMGDDGQYLCATAPIRDAHRQVVGAYVVQRPLREELVVVERMQRSLVLVSLFAVLAGFVASYALANGVGRRIMRVVHAAEALSGGDWSQRVPMEGPDDIRILADAFNRMAARLQGWDAELRTQVTLRTEELNQALTRLDANLSQMRQFHADASHELRTPLTIMRGEVEVALRSVRSPEEYQRVLQSILEEMNRVSGIVDHLLMLARADSGQLKIESTPVEVNDILQDLHVQLQVLAASKQISLSLTEEEPVFVLGDSTKLRQLFLNLIENAVKYTPAGGEVRVRVGSKDGFVMVQVSDSGIGIAQEDIPHIFDRFFRADRARSREMGGSGLGLAICQWIVKAHQGWIDVQSSVGKGSTFSVYLPPLPSADA